jgi:hypothetical protein
MPWAPTHLTFFITNNQVRAITAFAFAQRDNNFWLPKLETDTTSQALAPT